jgi:hypothetical protein
MSWTWLSTDHGKSWQNLPGPAVGPVSPDVYNKNFGDEGDMSQDDAGNVYFVDTDVTDITFTSWHASGPGKVAFKSHLPIAGFGEPVDDRPWVTAHLDGHVFYFGNEGDQTYSVAHMGEAYGPGTGPGRYTVYASKDGGTTWDHVGIQLKDSGWCRPAAAPRSSYVYALCGNDKGTLYSYVSANDGAYWVRHVVGSYNAKGPGNFQTWPSLQVLPNGTLWGSYLDPDCLKGGVPTCAHIRLFRSTDHGAHWKHFDITPAAQRTWQMEDGTLSVSADGTHFGYAVYARPSTKADWKIYGTTFRLGQRPVFTLLDPAAVVPAAMEEAPGDFIIAALDPANRFTVVWTRSVIPVPQAGRNLYRDIYSATSR